MNNKTKDFIEKAIKTHEDKYDYTLIEYKNCDTKVKIKCKFHDFLFDQTPYKHVNNKQGCPKCAIITTTNKSRLSQNEFIKKAQTMHEDKYDYTESVYKGKHYNVIIKCKEHGPFSQTPHSHLRYQGCPKCAVTIKNDIRKLSTKEFIEKAKEKHNDKYDYKEIKDENGDTKIIIICKEHGDFQQSLVHHLNGAICPKCLNINRPIKKKEIDADIILAKQKSIGNKFIEKAKEIHEDKYDYSKVKYVSSEEKVIIICKDHGEFKQTPHSHVRQHGCSKCSIVTKNNIHKLSTEEFIKKAKEKYNNKYDYREEKGEDCNIKIIIICKEHGHFEQSEIYNLTGGICPKCLNINKPTKKKECDNDTILIKQRSDFDRFIEKAKEIHKDKYDYSDSNYINITEKIKIKCNTCNIVFDQSPHGHLRGYGCKKCAVITVTKKNTLLPDVFIKRAKKIHGEKYDYSKINYTNFTTKINIICKDHGEFEQTPLGHLSGKGCFDCGIKKQIEKQTMTTEEFTKKANCVHKNKYQYKKVDYKHSNIKVIITCKEHGDFNQLPVNHLRGYGGCPKCSLCPKCLIFRTCGRICFCCKYVNKKKSFIKEKELNVVKFLKDNLPENEFIHNRSVGRDCTNGQLFPDIRFDCNNYNLIVEVDEYEHRGSDYECDKQRMYDIIAKLGIPCIFIRYNPDNRESNLNTLLETVKKYINLEFSDIKNIVDDYGFKVVYLFYKNNGENIVNDKIIHIKNESSNGQLNDIKINDPVVKKDKKKVIVKAKKIKPTKSSLSVLSELD